MNINLLAIVQSIPLSHPTQKEIHTDNTLLHIIHTTKHAFYMQYYTLKQASINTQASIDQHSGEKGNGLSEI